MALYYKLTFKEQISALQGSHDLGFLDETWYYSGPSGFYMISKGYN